MNVSERHSSAGHVMLAHSILGVGDGGIVRTL